MNSKNQIDDLNWHILSLLQKQGRASYAEIGRAVGLSAPAVTERVQKMEDAGIIKGYKVVLDPEKLGYNTRSIVHLQVDRNLFDTAIKKLKDMPEVLDCFRTTGTSSLIILAAFTSMHHMEQFLNALLEMGEPVSSIVLSHPISGRTFQQH
ncbi:MAG: Lrp/AsnC family transcriptional regulator [Rhodothermales bacterium]